jgi:hypothetical protein
MGNFLKTQYAFSNGEIAPEFYATNNVSGVAKLENMDVLQSGGLKRRPGLKKIRSVSNSSVIVPFVISESEKYLLVIYESSIDVFQNDVKLTTLVAPWHASEINKLQYAQRFNEIFFVHPNYKPRILSKTASGFSISNFNFYMNTDVSINIPFMRFEDTKEITITITNSDIDNNHAVFTASADMWDNSWVNVRLLVNDKQWVVESVQSERVATVYTNGNFTVPNDPISEWYESAFSNKRGWPQSVSFHQNRLVFGGTPSVPNNIWMSKVGEYNNFDIGTGLEDEAIFATLLSSQHHQICTIVSSYALQILTSVGEWAISNSPLTPSNVDIKQHTSVGCWNAGFLPPQQIDGSTVFVSASGKDIRELDLDTLNEKYNATDLCTFSKHLMNNPTSMAYNPGTHQLFVVMNDGYMAVYNKYASTDVSAWARYTTDGLFKYVSVINNETYVIVKRGNTSYLEKFDDSCLNDAENYGFSYRVSALPMIVNGHAPKKIRLKKISLRVMNTKTLFVNDYRMEIPNYAYDADSNGYTGDLSMNILGTQIETMEPLWSISSSEQLPVTILSVTTEGRYLI